VSDAERLDPALLPERERDEEPQLDQLGHAEVRVELLPERVVRYFGIPDDRAGVRQRNLFTLAELRRSGELEQIVVLIFTEAFPSSLDGALDPSVFAVDRLRYVDATQLLDTMVTDAVPKSEIPRL
jgi:hypothetical protein